MQTFVYIINNCIETYSYRQLVTARIWPTDGFRWPARSQTKGDEQAHPILPVFWRSGERGGRQSRRRPRRGAFRPDVAPRTDRCATAATVGQSQPRGQEGMAMHVGKRSEAVARPRRRLGADEMQFPSPAGRAMS